MVAVTVGSVFFVAAILAAWASLNPLRRSEAAIQADLLHEAPLGSTTAQVEAMIQRHGWKLSYPLASTGFFDQRSRPARETGTQHFRASLGDYRDIPFQANVTVFWGFDRNGRLTDLWVWKTWNGL